MLNYLAITVGFVMTVSGYGANMCRKFEKDQLVEDFNADDLNGQWFPLLQSTSGNSAGPWKGRCPVAHFDRLQGTHPAMATKLEKMSSVADYFQLRTSYKGQAGIVDNERTFRGYFNKGHSNGSKWAGAVMKPLKKFDNNFQVVSTDYDQYAILYECTHMTAMYNKDIITVLVREAPGVQEPSEELMNTIRDEFNRIFGDEEANDNEEEANAAGADEDDEKDDKFLNEDEDEDEKAGADDEDKDEKDAGAEDKDKEDKNDAGKDEKDAGAEDEKDAGAEDEKDAGAKDKKKEGQDDAADKDDKDAGADDKKKGDKDEKDASAEDKKKSEEKAEDAGVVESDQEKPDKEEEGAGATKPAAKYNKPNQDRIKGNPLNFDSDLKLADHEGCDQIDSYPDLSMTLTQRNKVKEDQKRAEREASRP